MTLENNCPVDQRILLTGLIRQNGGADIRLGVGAGVFI